MSYSVQWHRLPVSGPKSSHVWVWHLTNQAHDAESIPPAGQWEEIDPANLQTPFLALISQLADTWTVLERGTTLKTWARPQDIRYVQAYPLILAFQTSGERTLAPDPAPQIGELGLAIEGEALHLYTLETLGEAGVSLCSQLQTALAASQGDLADSPGQELAWREAQETARELAKLYWEAHKASGQFTPSRKAPPMPYVVSNTFLVTGALPVQAALAAYSNAQSGGGQWKEDQRQLPTFTYAKGEGTTHVQVRPHDLNAVLDDSTVTALWQQVRQFSDLDGDVFLAMLAQAIATPPDEQGCVWIKGTQILDYRGIKPKMHQTKGGRKRQAGHRPDDLADISVCIGGMSNTWLEVRQWIGDDETGAPGRGRKKARKRLFSHESRLVNITDTIYQYEIQFGGAPGLRPSRDDSKAPVAIAWRYQFGSWSDPFMKGPNRQIAWLLQQVLGYDPYHETWEKRLARYFTFHMRMNAAGGGVSIVREVGSLIGELSLPVDYRNPEKTKQRLERAMNRLVDDGQIDDWAYLEDIAQLPPRKWIEVWLTYTIQVHAAPIATKLPAHERQLLHEPAGE